MSAEKKCYVKWSIVWKYIVVSSEQVTKRQIQTNVRARKNRRTNRELLVWKSTRFKQTAKNNIYIFINFFFCFYFDKPLFSMGVLTLKFKFSFSKKFKFWLKKLKRASHNRVSIRLPNQIRKKILWAEKFDQKSQPYVIKHTNTIYFF